LKLKLKHFSINPHKGGQGESNGKLPLRTRPGCSVPEPNPSPDCTLVPAQTSPRAEY